MFDHPEVGTIWRCQRDGNLYEVVGHKDGEPLAVILRPLTKEVRVSANAFQPNHPHHGFEDMTGPMYAEWEEDARILAELEQHQGVA